MENIPNEIVDNIHHQIIGLRRKGFLPRFLIVDEKTFVIISRAGNGYFMPIYQTEEKIAHIFLGLLVATVTGKEKIIEVRQ